MNKKISIFLLVTICYIPIFCVGTKQKKDLNSIQQKDITYSWSEIHQNAKNAVVQIFAYHQFFNWEEPYQNPREITTLGSGFFINSEGYLLTNYHVVEQANIIQIKIPELGQERFRAEVVGCYPDKDFALLKLTEGSFNDIINSFKETINSSNIPYFELGDSDEIKGSQDVMCLGYPLGQENLKSSIGNISGYQTLGNQAFIQTTAPINHGNSGGPFLNAKGQVIGLADCVIRGDEAQNIGYFIPISEIKMLIEGLLENKYNTKLLRKPGWGAIFQSTTEDMLTFLGYPSNGGIRVTKIIKNSYAEKLGLKVGDILHKIVIKNKEIKIDRYGDVNVSWCDSKISLSELAARMDIGEKFSISVYRTQKNGKVSELKFDGTNELGVSSPIYTKYPEFEKIDHVIVGGMVVMELTENHLDELKQSIKNSPFLYFPDILKYDKDENKIKSRLIVTHIFSGTEIASTRCIGDYVILSKINCKNVDTLDDLSQALTISEETGYLTIETESGAFTAIPYNKIKEDDNWLSRHFNLSTLKNLESEDRFDPAN